MPESSATSSSVPSNSPSSLAKPKSQQGKNSDFQQCLKQYATAALGVAGVSALAAAQAPTTHIVYTPANIPLTEPFPGTVVPIDFNHDGVTDITISATGFSQAYSGHGFRANGSVFEATAAGNIAIGGHAIPFGVPLSQAGAFKSAKQEMAWAKFFIDSSAYNKSSGGPFQNVTNKYLGVKFKINGQFHFGWIRVSISTSYGFVTGTISGYAFNSIANTSITAGQMHPLATEKAAIEDVPTGSLGALAAGAPAIPSWRK